jgi:hypothetical protein
MISLFYHFKFFKREAKEYIVPVIQMRSAFLLLFSLRMIESFVTLVLESFVKIVLSVGMFLLLTTFFKNVIEEPWKKLKALSLSSARIRMPKYWIHAKNKKIIPSLFMTFLDVIEVPEHNKEKKGVRVCVCVYVCLSVCLSVISITPLFHYTTEVAMVPKSP